MNSTTTTDDNRKRIYIERVAELLGISIGSIRTYANNGKHQHRIPPPSRELGRKRLYWLEDEVLSWINTRLTVPLPEHRPRGRPSVEEQFRRKHLIKPLPVHPNE